MVEQRPFKPLVVGSTPTAPTKNPDDSVVLALLNLPNKAIKRAVLVPRWSQLEKEKRWWFGLDLVVIDLKV